MTKPKISIIGAGNVGATTAYLMAAKELGNIVLFDIAEGIPQGKALDMQQASHIEDFNVSVKGTNNYEDTKNSDIIVVSAGIPRKPGMSRDELLANNAKIVKEVTLNAIRYSPNSILIVVTNPLDAMAHVAAKISNFSKKRVIGMAGILDSARFSAFIAQELNVAAADVDALVIGSHSDLMVPLARYSTVNGIPITELISKEKIDVIVERTRKAGQEIVNLLKTGSAFYAPAASIMEMIEAIVKDKKKVLPCTAYCTKYKEDNANCFIGVPVKLGKEGVEQIIELELTQEEKDDFNKSVKYVKGLTASAEKFLQDEKDKNNVSC
ncbi:malate dehydrogenase [Candidatus Woesearchaeota archaeon]|nr:malate dehydrogenase [Candidatus Woesearchaeota archaeon]